jgi:hypothetical protein
MESHQLFLANASMAEAIQLATDTLKAGVDWGVEVSLRYLSFMGAVSLAVYFFKR